MLLDPPCSGDPNFLKILITGTKGCIIQKSEGVPDVRTCTVVFNESRTNIGLSPTMGFLNENDSLAYFCNLGRLVVRSVFYCGLAGFFKTLKFSLIISSLFQKATKDIPRYTIMFSWLKKTKYQKRSCFGFLREI